MSASSTQLYKETMPTGEETVEEVDPQMETDTSEAGSDTANGHQPVSFTLPASRTSTGDEAMDTEAATDQEFSIGFGPFSFSTEAAEGTTFESVEGFQESDPTESGEVTESSTDAWFAEASEAEQQEFFQFLAPLIIPAIKTLVPVLATAASKNLPGVLSGILQRLGSTAKTAPRRRESWDETGVEASDLEATIQSLETIVDYDDRVRVQNTTVVPWRRICNLQITARNGKRFLGTGALIGSRTVITAGHCVYMHSQGGWPASITVSPGRNGSEKPFGAIDAVGLRSVKGWVQSKQRDYDYGAIILPQSFANKDPSGFGFANLSDTVLRSARLNTAGYPGDKPTGTMWFAGRRARAVTPRTLVYNTATMGGQSGSPVWIKKTNGQRLMVGIHTNGSPSGNSATRITAPVMANMKNWRAEAEQGQPAATKRQTVPRFQSQMEPA